MLSDDIKELEEEIKRLERENFKLKSDLTFIKRISEARKQAGDMLIPVKVYTHKKRRNTTVKFKSGMCVTVKRKLGEKDCIETAIAYCVLKQLITKNELEKLIKEREEH